MVDVGALQHNGKDVRTGLAGGSGCVDVVLRMCIGCQREDVERLIAESRAQGSSGLEARLCEGRT